MEGLEEHLWLRLEAKLLPQIPRSLNLILLWLLAMLSMACCREIEPLRALYFPDTMMFFYDLGLLVVGIAVYVCIGSNRKNLYQNLACPPVPITSQAAFFPATMRSEAS